jgi:hypothetical protein
MEISILKSWTSFSINNTFLINSLIKDITIKTL